MSNWYEFGVKAFNTYVHWKLKTGSNDEAQEYFEDEISEKMEAEGIEEEWGWENDLPSNVISSFLEGVISQSKKYQGDEGVTGPLHTHLSSKISMAEDTHGEDQCSVWFKLIDEE